MVITLCFVFVVLTSFAFVTLAEESDMTKALSLSGSSLKGGALSIEVSKRGNAGGSSRGGFTSPRGGFTSPRGGGGNQGGFNRGKVP